MAEGTAAVPPRRGNAPWSNKEGRRGSEPDLQCLHDAEHVPGYPLVRSKHAPFAFRLDKRQHEGFVRYRPVTEDRVDLAVKVRTNSRIHKTFKPWSCIWTSAGETNSSDDQVCWSFLLLSPCMLTRSLPVLEKRYHKRHSQVKRAFSRAGLVC